VSRLSAAETAVERKSFADLVARAFPRGDAFVEDEGAGGEAGKFWLPVDLQLQVAQFPASAFAFAARQRDVRMVRARFWAEAAGRCGGGDGLLEREKLRRDIDIDEEDSGAVEGADCAERDGDGRLVQFAQASDNAVVLIRHCPAEELQRDVPGFWRGPAQAAGFRALACCQLKMMYRGNKLLRGGGGKRNSDEETSHYGIELHGNAGELQVLRCTQDDNSS
jgi:hypothetical protein